MVSFLGYMNLTRLLKLLTGFTLMHIGPLVLPNLMMVFPFKIMFISKVQIY
jgi:hypothetical protein